MLQIDKQAGGPYYVQIYEYFRCEIEQGRLTAGVRLPSVRELAERIQVSKMTVEKAYRQLAAEGYILRHHKARYEVTYLERAVSHKLTVVNPGQAQWQKKTYLYDFGSGDMDMEGFPLGLWRKYMNRVLADPVYLAACDDEQGVPALRAALSKYIYETRGVQARPEHIVIAAGTTALLQILTTILKAEYSEIAVENPGFRLGREVFRSAGYTIFPVSVERGILDIDALQHSRAQVLYISPSHQFPTGAVMMADVRHRLIAWIKERKGIIIEDDYDSELRYYGRPVPALQGLDGGEHVVYMGSLSKILPFFVRVSYMVLPARLWRVYQEHISLFRQGASVPEQCVLATYISTGELNRQVRRLRKSYQVKGNQLEGLLRRAFGDAVHVRPVVSGVYCHVHIRSSRSTRELVEAAAQQGCRVLPVQLFYETPAVEDKREFLLSFTKIPASRLFDAVQALYQAWNERGNNHV